MDGIMEMLKEHRRNYSQTSISDAEWEQRKREKDEAYLREELKRKQLERIEKELERSGLKWAIQELTFERFKADHEWQKKAKDICQKYAENPTNWLLLSGQSGCGKTHLCTAIVGELIKKEIPVWYMLYREDIGNLKQTDDWQRREKLMNKFKKAKMLYIDDLFKGGATEADIRIMFELIDYRYRNNLITIISTEQTSDSLKGIDESIAGRILQKSKKVLINIEAGRNYRFA